jgi:hypothetical protein
MGSNALAREPHRTAGSEAGDTDAVKVGSQLVLAGSHSASLSSSILRDNCVSAEDPILLMYAARYSKQVMAFLSLESPL